DTLKLCTSRTITDTSGDGTYSASFLSRTLRSWFGVRPAAWTSLTSGSEIFPSGRTGTVRLIALLFHTEISSMSSGPIRYSPTSWVWANEWSPSEMVLAGGCSLDTAAVSVANPGPAHNIAHVIPMKSRSIM